MPGRTHFEHSPAAARLTAPGVCHDEVLSCIADVFGDGGSDWLATWLDEQSRPLFGAGLLGLREQGSAVTELLLVTLGLRPDAGDHRALLADHAVEKRRAHPLLIAALGHELARRAGLHVHVCTAHRAWWTVLVAEEAFVLVGSGPEPPAGKVDLRLRCPHQVAWASLVHLLQLGPPELHGTARQLIAALPVCNKPTSS